MADQADDSLRAFPATQWSLVERARQSNEVGRQEGLGMLLHRYLPALRAHLLVGRHIPAERADDLLQGFIADKIIEQQLLNHAREGRGKFRTFLLVTLNHYVISKHRSATAAKRSPDLSVADLCGQAEQIEGGVDPARQFNTAWARELIAEALRRMEAECVESKRADVWTVFQGRVLKPAFEGQAPVDYTELVAQLGLGAPLQACHLLTTAKRMFARNLRSVASEYAGPESDTDEEIEELRKTLAGE